MSRDVEARIRDIERRCDKIINHTSDRTQKQFFENEWNLDASLYNLIVIGEAVKNLPGYLRQKHREKIPFDSIAGARDIYAHEYYRLNYDMIWNTLTEKVPELLQAIKQVKKEINDE